MAAMALLVVAVLVFIFFMGFFLAIPLCFLIYLRAWKKMRWRTVLVFTAVVAASLSFGFHNLIQQDLWRGAVPELIHGWA